MRRYFRWFHWLKAHLCGYYWLPCAICGEYRGGHEKSGTLMTSWGSGVSVCVNCIPEAERRNKEFMEHYSLQMLPNGAYIPLYDGIDERQRFSHRFEPFNRS